MTAPYERPLPGAAADFAAVLAARLPVIETARLRLRAPVLADFDAWAEILCGPAGPYLGGPFSRDDAFIEFAASCGMWLLRGFGPWAVEPKTGGDILGFVLIGFEPGDAEPELGYLFHPGSKGHGFATEAAAAARDHGFAAMGLARLASYIAPENAGSIRVASRLGAVRMGSVDGSENWLHHPAAQGTSPALVKAESGIDKDATKTSERGH